MLSVVRRLQEFGRERKTSLCMRLIDLENVHSLDVVCREQMREVHARFSVSLTLQTVIRQVHEGI